MKREKKNNKQPSKQKGNWTELGSRAERWRKKKQGQRDREAKRGMGTRTVGYKQGVGREIAERVRSREAERMTEREEGKKGLGSRTEKERKAKRESRLDRDVD